VALGDHLRAHQHIDVAGMHRTQLRFPAAPLPRVLSASMRAMRAGRAIGPAHVSSSSASCSSRLLGATAHCARCRGCRSQGRPRYTLGESAVVAAQRAIELVKDAPGAAMRAAAFPSAVAAVQHRRPAAAVEQQQRLLAARHALANGRQQRRRDQRALGLARHVHPAHARQAGGRVVARRQADAAWHGQALVAARAFGRRRAGVPAFQRRRG
jgi:hypothetical protein